MPSSRLNVFNHVFVFQVHLHTADRPRLNVFNGVFVFQVHLHTADRPRLNVFNGVFVFQVHLHTADRRHPLVWMCLTACLCFRFIYTLLTDPVLSSHVPPVLIVCNKQDQTMAKSAKVIQDSIEKEM